MGIVAKAKFGFISFIVLGAVLWLGTPLLKFTKDRSRSPEVFTLEVSFTPKARSEGVLVSWFVNGRHIDTEKWSFSPWVAEHHGERADVVKLYVTQSRDGEVACSIFRSSDLAVFSNKILKANQACEVQTK